MFVFNINYQIIILQQLLFTYMDHKRVVHFSNKVIAVLCQKQKQKSKVWRGVLPRTSTHYNII